MRIALFTDTYAPSVNGVARTLQKLVRDAARRGHDVALVTPDGGAGRYADARVHIRLPGLPLPMYPEVQISRPLGIAGSRELKTFAPDLVHAATELTIGWSGVRWARDLGVPLVTSFHTKFPEYLSGYGLGRLEPTAWGYLRTFHSHSLRTYCPSQETLRELRSNGFDGVLEIWSRGVDSEHFHPSRRCRQRRRELSSGAESIALYVGRLAPEKRVEMLLDAWEIVSASADESLALWVVGDGPSAAELKARAPGNVLFTGYLEGDELARTFASADLFLFPSDTETFGNVVLEAMSSGLPVIGPDRGGVPELIRPAIDGLLFRSGNAEELAAATHTLLSDASLRKRLARAARRSAEQRSWDSIFDGLFAGYREAIRRGMRATAA
ncbi:MAG: glycosyltransferase family 1 protein [marine benthic group bacterium]|nr:glycosyltransferase family 1 protein [Gemmatimonadota bacterium]